MIERMLKMGELVYCKDCAYAEPNNLDAYHTVKLGVFCTLYKQNTAGIHGCDNGKPKQKTNADRIRAMSDEELAREFTRLDMFCCPVCGVTCANEPKCQDCFKRWLKEEAET